MMIALTGLVVASLISVLAYGAKGYADALDAAPVIADRADALTARGRSGQALGPGRLDLLLLVQDPAYAAHGGVDVTTAGAGLTTVTQSLAKRLAFDAFRPGVRKVRQTGYALGLERGLTKDQILALWLDTVWLGRADGASLTGFFSASEAVYARPPAELTDDEFVRLVAVLIAPARFDLKGQDAGLDERAARIRRLAAGACRPLGNGDVWLEGCASGA